MRESPVGASVVTVAAAKGPQELRRGFREGSAVGT